MIDTFIIKRKEYFYIHDFLLKNFPRIFMYQNSIIFFIFPPLHEKLQKCAFFIIWTYQKYLGIELKKKVWDRKDGPKAIQANWWLHDDYRFTCNKHIKAFNSLTGYCEAFMNKDFICGSYKVCTILCWSKISNSFTKNRS